MHFTNTYESVVLHGRAVATCKHTLFPTIAQCDDQWFGHPLLMRMSMHFAYDSNIDGLSLTSLMFHGGYLMAHRLFIVERNAGSAEYIVG